MFKKFVQKNFVRIFRSLIDTEIKAKRNNMVSELITVRITKAKAKVKFGVKYLCVDMNAKDHLFN